MLRKNLKSYCEETTLHGLKYLSNQNSKPFRLKVTQKVFWSVSVVLSFLGGIYLTAKVISEIKKTPIVSLVSNIPIAISEIPFPAVTFCPEFRSVLGDPIAWPYYQFHVMGSPRFLTFKEFQMLQAVDLIFNEEDTAPLNITFVADEVLDFMKNHLVVRWKETVLSYLHIGNWMQKYTMKLATIPTRYGFCFNFNLVEPDELMHIEKVSKFFNYSDRDLTLRSRISNLGYKSVVQNTTYPWKTHDRRLGFQARFYRKERTGIVRYDVNNWMYKIIFEHRASKMSGVKFMLHDPRELPFRQTAMFYLPYLEKSHFLVDPVFTQLDESLHLMSPEERNCYMENEKVLQFFKFYTKNNCEHECLSDHTLRTCGCVQFWMITSNESRICSVNERNCHVQAEQDFYQSFLKNCKCYEKCDGFVYKFEAQQSDCHISDWVDTRRLFSHVDVLFRENFIFPLTRFAKYNFVDFMSNLGGIMGLMIGCSFISFIELFYFIVMRPISGFMYSRRVHPLKSSTKVQSKLKKFLIDFLENTSVHAAFYIAKRNWIEKIFWTAILILSSLACFLSISKLHHNLQHPIVISLGSARSVDSVPFPSITYMEDFNHDEEFRNKSFYFAHSDSEIWNEFDNALNESNRFDIFLAKTVVCSDVLMFRNYPFDGYERRIVTTLANMSQAARFDHQHVTWNSKFKAKFWRRVTSSGIGYTFNSLPPEEIFNLHELSPDFQFFGDVSPHNSDLKEIEQESPLKTDVKPGAGLSMILSGAFSGESVSDNCFQEAFVVHKVDELPTEFFDGEFCEVKGRKLLEVLITPEVMETEEEVKDFPFSERRCYMDGERKLKFFKKYSVRNCEMECLTKNFLKVCECVPFYMIRSDDMPVCKAESVEISNCIKYLRTEVNVGENSEQLEPCDCLSTCDTLNYKLEFFYKNIVDDKLEINFRYKDSEFTPLLRYRRVTPLSFLADSAGLLGLYCGISILTIVETLYFLILRPIVNLFFKRRI